MVQLIAAFDYDIGYIVLLAMCVLVNPNWTLLLENSQTLQVTDRH